MRRHGKLTLDRLIRLALTAPLAVALFLYGSTKRATVSFPQTESGVSYLIDRGSFVTNDSVHIDFSTRIVPSSANLFVDYLALALTNSEDYVNLVTATIATFPVPVDIQFENATNYIFTVYTDWTPGPTVQTNGVLHANWGRSIFDGESRKSGIAVGIPVQTTVWLDGDMVGTPGGTNSLSRAAEASDESDELPTLSIESPEFTDQQKGKNE